MSDILQKILKLWLLTEIGPEVYVTIMATVLANYYDYLVDNMKQMKGLKLKDIPGKNVVECCDDILVDVERLDSAGTFKPEHLGYIIRIFEDTSDYILRLWLTHKYKEVMEFVKKLSLFDKDVMQTDYIITYGLLFQ